MKIISFIFLIFIIILGVTFATLNSAAVTINYYIGHKTLPLSLLLVTVLALGSLLGILVGFWLVLKAKLQNYQLKQKLRLVEKEVENLRAIPLQNKH